MILGEGESTGTVDEKNLISNEEPEKFENDVQNNKNEGEFYLSFTILSLKSMTYKNNYFFDLHNIQSFPCLLLN